MDIERKKLQVRTKKFKNNFLAGWFVVDLDISRLSINTKEMS